MAVPAHDSRRNTQTLTTKKSIFTAEEANQMLPLVRCIVRNLTDEFRLLRTAGREKRALEFQTQESDSMEKLSDAISDHSSRIEEYLEELSNLGIETRDLELGIIDFPTLINGEPAYLTWRQGEESVSFWHPVNKSFGDRQPLLAVTLA
ncbi:MAG: DUF2203 domain-containing protein [Bdellovibrionota bacterium]